MSPSVFYSKFNLKIYYSSLYYCHVWHYQDTNSEIIRREIDLFNWEKAFANTPVNEKIAIFNETILSILHSFIPHERLLLDGKDLPWLTDELKIAREFYIRRNNIKVDSIETGLIVIAHLLP